VNGKKIHLPYPKKRKRPDDSKIKKKIKELLKKGDKESLERAEYYKRFLRDYKEPARFGPKAQPQVDRDRDPKMVRMHEKHAREFAKKRPKDNMVRGATELLRSSDQSDKDMGEGIVRALTKRKRKRLDPRATIPNLRIKRKPVNI